MGKLEKGSSTGDFESWMKGLWRWGIALSRVFVERASGRAPSQGNPKDESEKALETGISLHRGSALREPGGGLVYRGL